MSDGNLLVGLMTTLGIVQKGRPILESVARPFDLPAERVEAENTVRLLHEAADRVEEVYPFKRGMGLAAPQIGSDRRAVVIRLRRDEAPRDDSRIELLNPTVLDMVGEETHYEGCLSFFNVRGLVTRPSQIRVAHTTLDGDRIVSAFGRGTAGLVMHEIDHIDGKLYERLATDGLLPVKEYRALMAAGRPPA